MCRMVSLFIAFLCIAMPATAQDAPPTLYAPAPVSSPLPALERENISPGLHRLAGLEPSQHIAYARIVLVGKHVPPGAPPNTNALRLDTSLPVLIAQCTKDAKGKRRFELLTNFDGGADAPYYPPWKSSGPDDLFAPPTEKTTMTFDFFGYTHVKPVKRQWELSLHIPGELRYNPPGSGSRNLEEITFYLQYLKALPTLRITAQNRAVQFDTTPWLAAIRAEPLCWASGV